MSYQPKNFRKFVATAAGAAVVVSAVAPAAGAAWTNTPDWMAGSLQDLVNYGVIDADSNLSATGEVTRGEVALYFARALKLDLENVENPNFTDVDTNHKYYNAIAALAAADKMNGTGNDKFEPDRVINRAEMASLIVKAFGYEYGNGENLPFTDLEGAEWAKNAIAALVDADIVAGVNEAQTLFAPTAKLTRQDTAAFLHKTMVAQGVNFDAVEVEDVKVATAKSLVVKFNQEVDTDDVEVSVKRGNISVVLDAKWNKEKTELTLSSESNLVTGDYTVAIEGEQLEEAVTETLTVETQEIGNINFVGSTLVKVDENTGKISFKVYDQYGTDITTEAASLVNNINWSASIAGSFSDVDGVLTFDANANFKEDQEFVITAVDASTGVSETETVTVGDEASVNTFTFGDVVLPEEKTRIYTGVAEAAQIKLSAKDQYNNVLKVGDISGVTLLSSDSNVEAKIVENADGEAVVNIDTTGLTSAKSVTITAVLAKTGQTVSKTIEVVNPAKADEVEIGSSKTNVVAKGDAVGSVVYDIEVYNQFGDKLTAEEIVEQKAAGNISISGTGALSGTTFAIEDDKTNENYGKIVNTNAVSATGAATIVVTSTTGETDSVNLSVKDTRQIATLSLANELPTHLIEGADASFELSYVDQYGDAFDAKADDSEYKVNLSVVKISGDDEGLTISPSGDQADESTLDVEDAITAKAVANKAGQYKVIAKLINANGETVSQDSHIFTVAQDDATDLTYELADISTLYKSGALLEANNSYMNEVKVVATDSQGNSYVVPSDKIKSVYTSNTDVAVVKNVDGKYFVGGANADLTENTDVIVTVLFETGDGEVKTLTQNVTVSKDDLKAASLKAVKDSTEEEVTTYTLATADLTAGIDLAADNNDVRFVVEDQFGGKTLTVSNFVITGTNEFEFSTGDNLAVSNNTLQLVDEDGQAVPAEGADFKVTAVTTNGLTKTLTFRISASN